MSTEDRVKVLENEFKLIKSELRQTLIGVRDYLLDMKLPTSPEDAMGVAKKSSGEGVIAAPGPAAETAPASSAADNSGVPTVQESPAYSEPAMAAPMSFGEPQFSSGAMPARLELPLDIDTDVAEVSSGDMPIKEMPVKEEDQEEVNDEAIDEASDEAGPDKIEDKTEDQNIKETVMPPAMSVASTAPHVNILANLIQWVAIARREIGASHLPVFLDIYATTGNLTDEMRDTILHLSEITAEIPSDLGFAEETQPLNEQLDICMEINSHIGQLPDDIQEKVRRLTGMILKQTAYSNKADNWSRLILELHGILTGIGTALRPAVIPASFRSEVKKEAPESIRSKDAKSESKDEINEEESIEEDSSENDSTEEDEAEPEEETPPQKGLRPARLRLVLPIDAANEQELDLGSLFISTDFSQKKGNGNGNGNSHDNGNGNGNGHNNGNGNGNGHKRRPITES